MTINDQTPATGDDIAALAALSPEVLALAMDQARERVATENAAATASDRVATEVHALLARAASLAAGADAAGLAAPDMTEVLGAAMTRVAPVTPEVLAAVIDPPAPVAATTRAGGTRRRVTPVRDWSNLPRGATWEITRWGAHTGSVRINVRGDVLTCTVLSGPYAGEKFTSVGRAVQRVAGDPTTTAASVLARTKNGRIPLATVNGMIALTRTENGVTRSLAEYVAGDATD